ncbi:MAG: alpha/beta hydrolase [Candidatus Bathyarchaeia archaeon]|nr:alpha/beta hydrolase [Candidatus Bathyarchaeota archaeon]
MPKVGVRGVKLYYEELGEGPDILLMHGAMSTARRDFGSLIDGFAEHFHVVAPDLRGFGRSQHVRSFEGNYYLEHARDMLALIEALNLDEPHLVGFSDAGEFAFLMALEAPERLRSIVASGVGGDLSPAFLTAVEEHYNGIAGEMMEIHGRTYWRRLLRAYLRAVEETARRYKDPLRRSEYHRIKKPVLIINGERDPYNPVGGAEALRDSLPYCDLWIVPGVGHTVKFEGFLERVRMFIDEHH